MSLTIFQKGKKLFQTIKNKVKRVENWDFFKGVSPQFFHLFIFGKIREESVFDDILERKKAFLDYKKEKVKEVENWDLGVSPWFLVKNLEFFYTIDKKQKVKTVKNWDFFKGSIVFYFRFQFSQVVNFLYLNVNVHEPEEHTVYTCK